MWLGKQQKHPYEDGEGQVGRVTIGGETAAVLLDSERRGLEVYSPGGYRWVPRVGQKVLVIKGKGEIPCVVGVRQGEQAPETVTLETAGGGDLKLHAGGAAVEGERIDLNGGVYVNGEPLEVLIARIAAGMIG